MYGGTQSPILLFSVFVCPIVSVCVCVCVFQETCQEELIIFLCVAASLGSRKKAHKHIRRPRQPKVPPNMPCSLQPPTRLCLFICENSEENKEKREDTNKKSVFVCHCFHFYIISYARYIFLFLLSSLSLIFSSSSHPMPDRAQCIQQALALSHPTAPWNVH